MSAFNLLYLQMRRMPLPPRVVAFYTQWFKDRRLFGVAVGVALAMCLYIRPKELCEIR